MSTSFLRFLQQAAASDPIQTLAGMLPGPVGQVLDSVATANPAPSPVVHGPLAEGEVLSGVEIFIGSVGVAARLEGVNLFQGSIDGGLVRGCNVARAMLADGEAQAVNLWQGAIHGGLIHATNIVIGDVHGGAIEGSQLLIGDVLGGHVDVHTHVGRVRGGACRSLRHASTFDELEASGPDRPRPGDDPSQPR